MKQVDELPPQVQAMAEELKDLQARIDEATALAGGPLYLQMSSDDRKVVDDSLDTMNELKRALNKRIERETEMMATYRIPLVAEIHRNLYRLFLSVDRYKSLNPLPAPMKPSWLMNTSEVTQLANNFCQLLKLHSEFEFFMQTQLSIIKSCQKAGNLGTSGLVPFYFAHIVADYFTVVCPQNTDTVFIPMPKQIARIAYEAWMQLAEFDGKDLPKWTQLSPAEQTAFIAKVARCTAPVEPPIAIETFSELNEAVFAAIVMTFRADAAELVEQEA